MLNELLGENPFDGGDLICRKPDDCIRCGSSNTSVDYGTVDDDENIPEEVKSGGVPIICMDCGTGFIGNWKAPNA